MTIPQRSVCPPPAGYQEIIDLVQESDPVPSKTAKNHPASKKHQVSKPILDMLLEVFPSPPPTTVVSMPRKPECMVTVQKLSLRASTIYQEAEDGTLNPKGKTSDQPVSMAHLQWCCQVVSSSVNKAMELIVQQTVQGKRRNPLTNCFSTSRRTKNDATTPKTTNPGGKNTRRSNKHYSKDP